MNISKLEQRALHVLAQGGHIRHIFDARGHIAEITCYTRDGYGLADCTLSIFKRLKAKRLIESKGGRPYVISRKGRLAVRSQPDNR